MHQVIIILVILENFEVARFTRVISKFSKMHSGNLSKIALPNMWLLVLTNIINLTIIIY